MVAYRSHLSCYTSTSVLLLHTTGVWGLQRVDHTFLFVPRPRAQAKPSSVSRATRDGVVPDPSRSNVFLVRR